MKNKKKNIKINYKKFFRSVLILAIFVFLLLKLPSIIFAPNNEDKNSENLIDSKPDPITIHMSAFGDTMCHLTNIKNAYDASKKDYDFSNVFKNVRNYLEDADITIGNLETTFAGSSRGYTGYPTFNAPEVLGQNLKDMGVDVLTTANNHCMDKGNSGLVSTLDYLDKYEISHTGTARSEEEQDSILIKDVNGIKIAFLSYTYGTNGITIPSDKPFSVNLIDKELIKKHIASAKEQNVDVICVSMHWGLEYKLKPNSTQTELADFLFKNGVDIILGSHPHVLEPMEKRTITLEDGTTKDGFVIYSLGNFVSGQIYANTKSTVILDIQITKNSDGKISIDNVKYTPVYLYDKGAGAKTRTRYTLIDLEKSISDYENGNDSSISKSLYNTFKDELENIKKNVGNEIL
jgi:poly-gamma-glutamate capsule biosynthesis protein CapA/YwtB (metallophosphatase superfamily)